MRRLFVGGIFPSRQFHKASVSQFSTPFLFHQSFETMERPSLPQSRLTEFGSNLSLKFEPTKQIILAHLNKEDGEKQNIFLTIKDLRADITLATLELQNGEIDIMRTHLNLAYEKVDNLEKMGEIPPQPERSGNISSLLEEIVFIHAYADFFESGQLIKKSSLRACIDDNEYISGVLMFANHLSEYSINRAMHNDIQSVLLCRDTVQAINGCLISFDFRNGPLRRKYDGLKYALKNIEDLLFEQSLLGCEKEEQDGNVFKKSKVEATEPINRVDNAEFDAMRLRYEEYDGARESVIKGCREGQKLSKLAIYSIHRGQLGQSLKQMDQAARTVPVLMDILNKHPALREGSFNNMLEEWCEAKLFYQFVQDGSVEGIDTLLKPIFKQKQYYSQEGKTAADHVDYDYKVEDMVGVYLGGLVDLTGEIGRLAVAAGTKRDLVKVKQCHETTCVISSFLASLPPSQTLKKKGNAVSTNLRKMGQILYELSLAERGRLRASVDTSQPMSSAGADRDTDE